jgi:hypothetical protein
MYTSFVSAQQSNMGQSKGFRARLTQEVAPSKEDLTADFDTNQLLRLNQRILDGKAVVSTCLYDLTFVGIGYESDKRLLVCYLPRRLQKELHYHAHRTG